MLIGFIGLGVMGARMASRFIDAGYQVIVYNRSEEKMIPLVKQGARKTNTIRELAEEAEIICTCLSMPADVEQVYLGSEGVFAHVKAGAICLDFTTVGVQLSQRLAKEAEEKGCSYLDTPVSGGPEGAESGTLTIMAGGNHESFTKVQSLLAHLGSLVEYLGESGMGSAAKLINQYLVAVHSLAAAEAMVTGTVIGLNPELLYRILQNSYGDSRMLRRHVEGHILPRSFEPGGALKYLLKDLRLALPLMEQSNLDSCSGLLAERILQEACDLGNANKDMSAIVAPLEARTGHIVERKR